MLAKQRFLLFWDKFSGILPIFLRENLHKHISKTSTMAGRQVIVSSLFNIRGALSRNMMRNLMIRGGGVQVDDALPRHGWSEESPVATTVVTLEADSGAIRGIRYETRGKGPIIQFKASELWLGGDEKVTVKVKFEDLSTLPWMTEGEVRNQTKWQDSEELDYEVYHEEKGVLADDELDVYNVGGFSVRFTLLPVKVDKACLYGGIIPLSKGELEEKMRDLETDIDSPLIPTVAMKLAFVKWKH